MAKQTTRTKKKTTFPVKITLSFKHSKSFLVVTAYNQEHTIPVKCISFEEMLKLHHTNAQGVLCFWNNRVYYADHPTSFSIGTFAFDLLHDDFDSNFTIACLSQVAFYSTFSEKVTARNVECDSSQNYSLRLTMKLTASTYAEVQREEGQNPNQPRTCILFRNPKEIKNRDRVYSLKEVSRKELLELRCSKKPGLLLKMDNKLLYTSIPKDLDVTLPGSSDAKNHLCGNCIHVCQSCPRAKDQTVSFQLRHDCNFKNAVLNSWRPEKYRFMPKALETFNMSLGYESLVVLNCNMYSSIT